MPKKHGVYKGLLPMVWLLTVSILMLPRVAAAANAADKHNRETPVVKTVRAVSPAVVNVSTETVDRQGGHPFSGFGGDPFFEHFFRDFFESWPQREYRRTSLGSGIIIDGEKGHVLTNAHVIGRATAVTVTLMDEREFKAEIVGVDADSDLAVLRISADQRLPAVEMGASDDLMIGETVIAIGNPFGFSHTVTTGVISAVNRSIRTDEQVFHDFIQIDASINPGNSGGPLLNINGDLIGINTAIYAKAQGIGFAIPIDMAKRIAGDLISYGKVRQPWVGVIARNLEAKLADYLEVPRRQGVAVSTVIDGSPAARAGVKSGDIILRVNRVSVAAVTAYHSQLARLRAGDIVRISLWRDRRQQVLAVKTTSFPESQALALAHELLGIGVTDIDPALRQKHHIRTDSGVVVTECRPHSELERIGVKPGDVVRRVGDRVISGIADFKKAVDDIRWKNATELVVQRGRQAYSVKVALH